MGPLIGVSVHHHCSHTMPYIVYYHKETASFFLTLLILAAAGQPTTSYALGSCPAFEIETTGFISSSNSYQTTNWLRVHSGIRVTVFRVHTFVFTCTGQFIVGVTGTMPHLSLATVLFHTVYNALAF